jgi:hypothetical protein
MTIGFFDVTVRSVSTTNGPSDDVTLYSTLKTSTHVISYNKLNLDACVTRKHAKVWS